jgi:hypothetical protein
MSDDGPDEGGAEKPEPNKPKVVKPAVHRRPVDVRPADGPLHLSLDFGGGMAGSWIVRWIRDEAVQRVEQGHTEGGVAPAWPVAAGDLPRGASIQVAVTLMAPATRAPWQVRVHLRQGNRTLLADRGHFHGELDARKAESFVVVLEAR